MSNSVQLDDLLLRIDVYVLFTVICKLCEDPNRVKFMLHVRLEGVFIHKALIFYHYLCKIGRDFSFL